jgi:hypothetical protein
VPNGRFDRLSAFEPFALPSGERLVLAAMDDLNTGVVGIHAPVAQIDDDLLGPTTDVFKQNRCLLQLRAQNMSVIGLPGKVRAPIIRPLLCVTAMLALLTMKRGTVGRVVLQR